MKKALVGALGVIGFMLIAAPIYMNQPTYPVTLNGKKFANATIINGVIAISVQDFVKGAGGTLTLEEAGFKLQGNTLSAGIIGEEGMKIKVVEASAASNKVTAPLEEKWSSGQHIKKAQLNYALFHAQKSAQVSSRVFQEGGKAFLPLADVARAFGGTFNVNGGTLKPGETISLNFTKNANAALCMNEPQ